MTSYSAFFRTCSSVRSLALLAALFTFSGCADSGNPELTESQKQDEIIAHPMDYKPHVDGNSSGGDMSSFDNQSFGKDLHHFLDP